MTGGGQPWYFAVELILLAGAAAIATAGLIFFLRPLLARYALARPNKRSSHTITTPQGGGIAVIAITIIFTAGAKLALPTIGTSPNQLALVFVAMAMLAVVGAVDDIRVLEVKPRLLMQALAVAVVIAALPTEMRIFHLLPWWIERALLLLGGLWFVNLVNFMDGLDWMTVAEVVPVSAGLVLAGLLGALPSDGMLAALMLGGAIIGFAPFNRPVAKLFLGDVGSLPLGLLLGWLLVLLAGNGHLAAAVLLPLYYLADATITLIRRLINGEPVMRAHRTHFYQRATDSGFAVREIVARIFGVNILLLVLAAVTIIYPMRLLNVAAVCTGGLIVGALLFSFARGKQRS